MQPRHQAGWACLVTEVWPPPRNDRGPHAFSGDSFGPIDFPSGALPATWLPSKCARSSRVSRSVSPGNTQHPGAFWSGSFRQNDRLEIGLLARIPFTNPGGLYCSRGLAPVSKPASPQRFFMRFIDADRVAHIRIAYWLNTFYVQSLSLVG